MAENKVREIDQFAAKFRHNGVAHIMDETAKEFAEQWAQMMLAKYLLAEGTNKIQLGQQLLGQDPQGKKILEA